MGQWRHLLLRHERRKRRLRHRLGIQAARRWRTLTLIFESSGASELDFPDNLAVSPQGSLLLCEDGGGEQFMRGVTLDGRIFDFGKNLETDHEWAGATFADADPAWNDRKIRGNHHPLGGRWDRVTLFVNRQGETGGGNPPAAGDEGMTFAILGSLGRRSALRRRRGRAFQTRVRQRWTSVRRHLKKARLTASAKGYGESAEASREGGSRALRTKESVTVVKGGPLRSADRRGSDPPSTSVTFALQPDRPRAR